MLPEEYKIEQSFANVFPGADVSPVFPFSGIVINLNVQTLIHRDSEDVILCLVLAIGDFVNGDLCFSDAGLRIELQNGEWVVFDSRRTAHFNMPYVGRRASFVLHSDRVGELWVKNKNGWKEHNDFLA